MFTPLTYIHVGNAQNANKNLRKTCHPERSRGILTTRVVRSLGCARDDRLIGRMPLNLCFIRVHSRFLLLLTFLTVTSASGQKPTLVVNFESTVESGADFQITLF